MTPPRPRHRTQRPTLPPADEEKLAQSTHDLDDEIEKARRCTDAMQHVADAIDSERISMDGIVLAPLDEDDSLVQHIEESLRGLSAV